MSEQGDDELDPRAVARAAAAEARREEERADRARMRLAATAQRAEENAARAAYESAPPDVRARVEIEVAVRMEKRRAYWEDRVRRDVLIEWRRSRAS